VSDDRYADHDAAFEKDMDREVAEAEDVRLAGDEMPEWVERVRDALVNYGTWRMQKPRREKALAALDSIVELYEWTEAAREQLNIERITEKRRAERAEAVLRQADIYLQRSQFLVGADALIEDIRSALSKESGAAGTANESSHSGCLPTSDNAAPDLPEDYWETAQ
jgi:AcrR family transcriptional regulator